MTFRRPFYGWYIVGIAFFANFMSVGTGFYAFNAFMEPLCELRGWTRTDVNLALVIGTVFGFAGQFVYGTLVTRIGVRPLMMAGAMTAGGAFVFLGQVTQLWQFYLVYTLLFMGNGAYGGIVASTAVNNWFVNKRGKALGIATAGVSFSGAIVPLAALLMILKTGVGGAAMILAAAIVLVIPLAGFCIRDWPESIGMLPDGSPPPGHSETSDTADSRADSTTATALTSLLRSGTFWKLGTAYALLMIGTVGVMSQLKPRFVDIGFNDMTAMTMMAATALVGTAGKYVWGNLCDRFPPERVVTAMAVTNAGGLALALVSGSATALGGFILTFGFTMGGIMSTYPIIVAHLYGRKAFPSVLRFVSVFLILQLLGYIIAGRSYDHFGSYNHAYTLFIAFDLLAAGLLLLLKPPASSGRQTGN